MTISSTNRKAGPYTGTGLVAAFPFAFKIFSAFDVLAVRADANGTETVLTLTSDYTVSVNADQNANPGGTLTLPAPLAPGFTLTVASSLPYLQPTSLTNNGGFFPNVINNALDRLTIFVQQLAEATGRSLKTAISTPPGVSSTLPAPVPLALIGWNAEGNGLMNSDPTGNTALAIELASTDAGKGGALVGYRHAGGDSRTPGTVQRQLEALTSGVNQGYQVLPNKTIRGPDGKRFIARGVCMFDYTFVSYEPRTDYNYRSILNPPGKGPAYGISEPTYMARTSWKNEAHVEATIRAARKVGVNHIRIGVEPAMMFANAPYIDPFDGLTYPSDPEMLDTIIDVAERLGVAVQIQNANDAVPTANNIAFMTWLAARYFNRSNVWINPANEMNGTNGDASNPTVWQAEMRQYVQALRADIAGQPAGTKFLGPICVDAPYYGVRVDLIETALTTDTVFSADPNLIVQPHFYPVEGIADFRTTILPLVTPQWVSFFGKFCIMVGECGMDNYTGRLDPNIDPGVPSASLTEWANAKAAIKDFLEWVTEMTIGGNTYGVLNGCVGIMWYAYIPAMGIHDDNTIVLDDGSFTSWGKIYRDTYLAPVNSLLYMRRALGAQYSTGAWGPGDFADGAVTNAKLANVSTSTLKGRASGGAGAPEDLTSEQALKILAGLSARASNASMGTPVFQAEGVSGSKAAAGFIVTAASDIYVGFHNKTTGVSVGTIVGNGGTGVNYTSVSDYRLKSDPEDVTDADAMALFAKIRPVMAGWVNAPLAPREVMFLAHEVQDAVPSAVCGDKDGSILAGGHVLPAYQTLDYGKLTPVIAAALHVALKRLTAAEARIATLEASHA